jgi:hypothetical protein
MAVASLAIARAIAIRSGLAARNRSRRFALHLISGRAGFRRRVTLGDAAIVRRIISDEPRTESPPAAEP